MMSFIRLENVRREFDHGAIIALRDIDLVVEKGSFTAIMGPSGSGKSTLLHIIGALDEPSSGTVLIDGKPLSAWESDTDFRRRYAGMIFQMHNLIPTLTALENVQIPMFGTGLGNTERSFKARQLLQRVGLGHRLYQRSTTLSGGERQRVATARALANDPRLLLADEPTGSLDSQSATEVLQLLRDLQTELQTTIVMVTHDHKVAQAADKIIEVKDGTIVL